MRKFTFIAEFRGGTYISQYNADTIEKAIVIWGNSFNFIGLKKEKKILLEKLQDDFYRALPVDTVDNVWCTALTITKSLLLLNIIETV